jgi:hypothetical protein
MYAHLFNDVVHVPLPADGANSCGHVADDLISGSDTYEPVTCTACGGIHLINHKTGKLLEQAEKPWSSLAIFAAIRRGSL